jgi:hypothetical protein
MLRSNRERWSVCLLAASLLAAAYTIGTQIEPKAARAQVMAPGLTALQLTRLQRLAGQFAYVSGTSNELLRQSILAATQGLSASATRSVRAQLEATLLPARKVRFALEGGLATGTALRVQEGSLQLSTPLTGALTNLPKLGAATRVAQQLQNAALVQVVENRGLHQERKFSLDATGSTLTLDVRVTGANLASPVQTQAVYQRI